MKVGDKLWYVPGRRNGEPREVTVTKVGRVWFEIDAAIYSNARFSVETLLMDGRGYTTNERCYLSRREHEAECELAAAWGEFRRQIGSWNTPKTVTSAAQVRQAAEILGISLAAEGGGDGE